MSSRLLFLAGLMACLGAGCQDQEGAKLTLSFPNFKPGCIRVNVKDARGVGSELTRDLQESLATKTSGGQLTVAVLFQEGWGERLTFTATAYEQKCGEGPGFIASKMVDVSGQGAVPSVELTFDAVDQDGDGYVSRESGGRDCADDRADVHPGQRELCNSRDDNCDNRVDEGFELVGQQCGTLGSCQTWVCNAEGGTSCQSGPIRWYRDQDGDGEGTPQDSREACTQPAGYVNNNRDCDDTRKERYSTAKELCNGVNDNCDNEIDEGYNVGKACSDGTCGGQFECTTTTQSTCKVVKSTWYPDGDRDTHGKQGAAQTFCGSAQPNGYVASSDDCDDTKASVYLGAPELCDGLDNNCDNRTDESFDVGTACNAGNDCAGAKACAASGAATECRPTTAATQYYVDNDQDGYGGATGPLTCNPLTGYATQGGDCRDGNPYMRPNAAELCDGEDNDCNPATSEASVCPVGGASWKNYSSGAADNWRSVALYANGGVWVAGGDKLHHRRPSQTNFDVINDCTTGEDVYGIAANPATGDAVIGGNEGFVARHYPATNTCADKGRKGINLAIRGVHLVPVPGESLLENHFVGINTLTSSDEGRAVRVFDNIGTGYDNRTVAYVLEDVHGPSRDILFAVGGSSVFTTETSRVYRFNPGTGNWVQETVPGGGALLGVWVVHPKLAYAVGTSGTLLTWNGTAWSKVSGAPNEDLSSVVAFGTQSIYVTTLLGRVYYYNGTTWTEQFRAPSPLQFRDIAANSPADIWVVGTKGARYHWPQ